jgi:hypothetical protein
VWKIVGCLARYRPDLLLLRLDVKPAGFAVSAAVLERHPPHVSGDHLVSSGCATGTRSNHASRHVGRHFEPVLS